MIVVDSGSEDDTVTISKEIGATVIAQPFLGWIEQKNFAVSHARHDWLLSLDADEALSPALKKSLLAIKDNPQADGYSMNRLTSYCGTWVRHSGWYPDVKLRFFNKHKGAFAGRNPHDRYVLESGSTTLHLDGDLLHYSYYTLSDHLKQIDKFSTIGALAMYKQGKRSSILKLLYKPMARFMRHYIVKVGFLDGLAGYTIALTSAYAVFLKYLRLYYLHKGQTL
jgi:glycosyltransferase involved in cell wall biosynthesis